MDDDASNSATTSSTENELEREPVTEAEILANIQALHARLEQVRIDNAAAAEAAANEAAQAAAANGEDPPADADEQPGARAAPTPPSKTGRLIVVSNRLPVTLSRDDDGTWNFTVSSGGLVMALEGVKHNIPFVWVGWTGKEVDLDEQDALRKKFLADNCIPVFLNESEANLYYNGFCNDVLWPLFHYVPLPIVSAEGDRKFDYKYWDAYSRCNHRFAEAIMQIYTPGDLIWVQDYHLMLLPSLLRRRIRDASIGFFLHTPFPSSEVYRVLPVRNKVLQGVLAADLIGFHTYDYARHFLSCCTRILGLEASPKGVQYKNHFANVGIFPIGIDPNVFLESLARPYVQARTEELREKWEGKRVLLGVDRLDYIKGVPHKLMALENLLTNHSEWKEEIVLVQIAVPSRTEVNEYKKLISVTNELVGRINGKFGSVEYSPIQFVNQSVNIEDLTALYTIADVCVVSSVRDGMNLVSYEYVMCQNEGHGVLVLSEFAGSAQSLSGAIRVNPWNVEELAEAMHTALSVPARDRALRHNKLYEYVNKYTASFWAQTFVAQLQKVESLKEGQDPRMSHQSVLRVSTDVIGEARNRSRRLFILAYEGALCDHASLSDLAAPGPALYRTLHLLCSDVRNTVYIISGRSQKMLESWFDDLDVGLVAEHGCSFRHPKHPNWEPLVAAQDDASWRDSVLPILEYFTERTPGTVLDPKDKVITWHFRDADPLFGTWQAKELQLLLAESLVNLPVEVLTGKSFIELRPVGVNRVSAVQRIIAEAAEPLVDFIFALGADKADEDAFTYINQYVRTPDSAVLCCRVGGKSDHSSADRFVPDVESAVRALDKIATAATAARKPRPAAGPSASAGPSALAKRMVPAASPSVPFRVHRSSSYDTGMLLAGARAGAGSSAGSVTPLAIPMNRVSPPTAEMEFLARNRGPRAPGTPPRPPANPKPKAES